MPETDRPHVLVTGASSGIGRATAVALARQGWDVTLGYRADPSAAQDVEREILELGGMARAIAFDISDPGATRRALDGITAAAPLDALVLNAGLAHYRPLVRVEDPEVDTVISTNLIGFFNLVRPVLRGMVRRRRGAIVSVSSIAGTRAFPGQSVYAASKAGLTAATLSLAQEFGAFGIRANVVAPGLIGDRAPQEIRQQALATIPLGRAGAYDEVAEVIAFLCSPGASYVSGAVVPVTGGALP